MAPLHRHTRMFRPLPVAIGLRYLRAKRRNGFISFISMASILGIALGVTVLITTLAVMSGFQKEIRSRLLQMTVLSRYVDRWSCRDGRWAIDHRIAIIDMDEIREVTPMKHPARAARDRSDPSYTVLKGQP